MGIRVLYLGYYRPTQKAIVVISVNLILASLILIEMVSGSPGGDKGASDGGAGGDAGVGGCVGDKGK